VHVALVQLLAARWLAAPEHILKKVHVHFAAIAVPGARSPCFRADINITVAIDVTDLQFVAA